MSHSASLSYILLCVISPDTILLLVVVLLLLEYFVEREYFVSYSAVDFAEEKTIILIHFVKV
jgi:hypothetical protein